MSSIKPAKDAHTDFQLRRKTRNNGKRKLMEHTEKCPDGCKTMCAHENTTEFLVSALMLKKCTNSRVNDLFNALFLSLRQHCARTWTDDHTVIRQCCCSGLLGACTSYDFHMLRTKRKQSKACSYYCSYAGVFFYDLYQLVRASLSPSHLQLIN